MSIKVLTRYILVGIGTGLNLVTGLQYKTYHHLKHHLGTSCLPSVVAHTVTGSQHIAVVNHTLPDLAHADTPPPSTTPLSLPSPPQLFIDSFLAKGWASKYERSQQLEEKYKLQLMELDEIEREEAEALALGRQQQQHDGGSSAHFAMPPPLNRAPSFSRLVANGAPTADDKSRLLDGVESSNPNMAGR